MEIINVIAYNPQWPQQFEELKSVYSSALNNQFISIEHVGSTSVPRLAAKPILDIDIIVADEIQLNKVIPVIALLGYQFMGEMGIKGRYVFTAVSNLSPNIHTGILRPRHHLYCCIEGSVSLTNHLLFRDALRNDNMLVKQYAELKRNLTRNTTDIDVYVEGKSNFIADILYRSGISEKQIQDIVNQNKKKD